ncbi:MAG: hypothetical protein EAX90_13460 [Candidatus Heimdallarchaeota archaeon]|nr:hypothetical protein [Candidatus Heimdallarchaeota archaeon]
METNNLLDKNKKTIEFLGVVFGALAVLCAIAIIVISYLISLNVTQTDYDSILQAYFYERAIFTSETIFYLLNGLFMIPTIIGIYSHLRKNMIIKPKLNLLIPLITMILGYVLIIALYILKIVILFQIAPNYINGTIVEKEEIILLITKIDLVADIMSIVASVLIYLIGAIIFGIILLQYIEFNRVLIWAAVASGILSLGIIGSLLEGTGGIVLLFLAQIGTFLFYFWLIGVLFVIFRKWEKER